MLKYRRSESIYTEIYTKNYWGDLESVSGPGSNLEQSLRDRDALPSLLNEFGVSSILDVPCGEFQILNKSYLMRYKLT